MVLMIGVSAFMNDQEDVPAEFSDLPRERLKHGSGRYRHVILVPQPSDSPNDPLNVCIAPIKDTSAGPLLIMNHGYFYSGLNGILLCPTTFPTTFNRTSGKRR